VVMVYPGCDVVRIEHGSVYAKSVSVHRFVYRCLCVRTLWLLYCVRMYVHLVTVHHCPPLSTHLCSVSLCRMSFYVTIQIFRFTKYTTHIILHTMCVAKYNLRHYTYNVCNYTCIVFMSLYV